MAARRKRQGWPRGLFAAAAVMVSLAGPAAAEKGKTVDPALQAANALYDGIRTETLPNGLRVYLKPIPDAPTVTVMVAYKVGSADEDLDATGLSHYLEHLMFKGTDKLLPGDIDRTTLRSGGANNAYTSEDCTVYHFDFARDRWPIALGIEADRMRNLRIDDKHEFEQEKGAVINELLRGEDEPWELEMKAILPLLFGKVGPYGHPVIGEREHVKGATAKVIKDHYDAWYVPNNAALVMVGGFNPEDALRQIKGLFGALPAGELPPRRTVPEAKAERPVRQELVSKFEVPRLLVGFNTVPITDPDNPVFDVIQTVLAGGKSSRLYRGMVEGEEVATAVSAFNASGRYPGWFGLQVELLPGKDRARVEDVLLAQLKRLADEPVTDAELARVKQMVLADAVYHRESVHGLADSIARGVAVADLDWVKNYLPKLAAVTAADVQRVAKKYLDPQQRVVVWSVPPKGEEKGGAGEAGEPGKGKPGRAAGPRWPARSSRDEAAGGGAAADFSLQGTHRVVLPNGLTVLLRENRRLPIVVASAFVRDVRLLEPAGKAGLAALTGALLDEGTAQHKSRDIADLIEGAGGELSLSDAGGAVKVLTPHRSLGLGLLLECLREPTFPQEEFQREKTRQLAQIDEAEKQPADRAARSFRELAYGTHPFGRPSLGRRATVEPLTRDDCAAFHKQAFVPNNTILAVVGDFDAKEMLKEIETLTAGWQSAPVARPAVPPVEKPAAFLQKVITMPEGTQLHMNLGHVGVTRNDPDFYKLLVMDHVLGTGPGFTDRLSARLRDRQGLAYTVSANIATSASEQPGLFVAYIGTDPDNFDKVKKQLLEEIHRIRDEKPTEQEVADAKLYLVNNLPFRFTTGDRIAAQLVNVERFGLGFDYIADYKKAVEAVTPEDVQAVARKHLDPARMVLVAAGPVNDKGQPLPRAEKKEKE